MVRARTIPGIKPTLAAAGRIAIGGRINWMEHYPGFFLPTSWTLDLGRFPDYTDLNFLDKAGGEMMGFVKDEDGVEIARRPRVLGVDPRDVIRLRGLTQPTKQAWGAWLGAFQDDNRLRRGWPDLEHVADRMYTTARFKYLTPIWRQKIIALATELDDIEDQLSTILWIVGWVAKKWIPKPLLPALNKTRAVADSLDCAGKTLAGIGPARVAKSDYVECMRRRNRRAKQILKQKKGLLAWLRNNYGQTLEAAQASGTWTDVGIVLGPIMNVVEDGWWGMVQTSLSTPSIVLEVLEEPERTITEEGARRLYAPDAIEKAGPNYLIKQAFRNTWTELDKIFFEPMRAVDLESLEDDPFEF